MAGIFLAVIRPTHPETSRAAAPAPTAAGGAPAPPASGASEEIVAMLMVMVMALLLLAACCSSRLFICNASRGAGAFVGVDRAVYLSPLCVWKGTIVG